MKMLLLSITLMLLGLGAGAGLAFVRVQPTPDSVMEVQYLSFSAPFIIPIVKEGKPIAEARLNLALASDTLGEETFTQFSPILRDRILAILLDHANSGGFDGRYTDTSALLPLRRRLETSLSEAMRGQTGEVLITAISRNDFP